MAEDRKFKFENGKFVNRISGEEIPDDEPVIIFRARDRHALSVLHYYYEHVNDPHHAEAIQDRIREFSDFKRNNPGAMKEPGITHQIRLGADKS